MRRSLGQEATPPRPTGYIAYSGPSALDGGPVVVIVLTGASSNTKTGPMVQTYILRPDVDPVTAVRTGADASLCGTCRHRGDGTGQGRTCYVTLIHGPSVVYRTYRAGRYPAMTPEAIGALIAGRAVRLGTYGDPAAVPAAVWTALVAHARLWTGYTHAWSSRPELQPYLMASVDSPGEHALAVAAGWRTFRVRTPTQPLQRGEIACPASAEQGHRTTCDACGLCQGTTSSARTTIAIIAHGSAANRFGRGRA